MKKLIFLLSFIFVLGCAGRKSKTSIKEKAVKAEINEVKTSKVKTDSLSQKEEKTDQSKATKTSINEWRYTAPKTFPCDNQNTFIKPFWLMINGDSINVANMPAGASLENSKIDSESLEKLSKTNKELTRKISDLETKLKKKTKIQIVEKDKIKEVERQSLQWLLVCLAFLIGIFIKPLFKWILGLIKRSIKPI